MQSGSNQCLKLPREGYTHGELGLLLFGPAARWCVAFVFEGATSEREEDVARSDYQGHCLCFIRPLSIARGVTALNFHDVRSNVGTRRYAAHPLLVDAPPAMQQRSTIPPICPRNSRRLYVEARKGGWFRTLFCAVSLLAFHRSARNRMFPLRVPFATSIFQCLRVYSDVVRFCCFAILNSFFVTCENYRRFTES